jgi:hypothetical protein
VGRATIKISEHLLVKLLHLGPVTIQAAYVDVDLNGTASLDLVIEGDAVPDCNEADAIFTRVPESITVEYKKRR